MSESTRAPLAIVGAGSLGQAIGALLAQAGERVTLVATERSAAELLAAGAIRVEDAIELEVATSAGPPAPGRVAVATELAPAGEPVGLLFTTKAHQLAPAIDALGLPAERVAWAAGVQNGVLKDDLLLAAYGAERVLGAATIMGAQRIRNGRIRVSAAGTTFLGELDGPPSPRVEAIVATLTGAGVPARAIAEIRSLTWSKACNATGAFGVWMLVGPDGPHVGYDPDLMRAFFTLVRETAAIAAAAGAPVADFDGLPPMRGYVERPLDDLIAELPPAPVEAGPRALPSMLQDHLAGRPTEVEEVFGDIVARAERLGVPAPALAFTRDLLRGLARTPSR